MPQHKPLSATSNPDTSVLDATENHASVSVITHFEGFQKGVLDSRDVIFFLSIIGFSLFSTSVILRGHRAG